MVTVEDSGSIQGRVVDSNEVPVPAAAVYIAHATGSHPDIASETANDGSYLLTGLSPGIYGLRATATNYESREVRIRVRAGSRSEAVITLERL
jgi:protocatechuate 3,4-dioxygenase beta subunit